MNCIPLHEEWMVAPTKDGGMTLKVEFRYGPD